MYLADVPRPLEPAPTIALGGRIVRSETRVDGVGAWHVVLRTVLRDLGVELQSSYTGHDHLSESGVIHLVLAPELHELEPRLLSQAAVPVVWARRRCLYDHLQRLQDLLGELGHDSVEIDVLDDALLAVDQ